MVDVPFTEGFEGGTNGTDFNTTPPPSFSLFSTPTSFAYTNAYKHSGSLGCRMTVGANNCAMRGTTGGVTAVGIRHYMKTPAGSGAWTPIGSTFYWLQARGAGSNKANSRVNSDGTITLRNGSATTVSSVTALQLGGIEYRFEYRISSTTQILDIYVGPNVDGSTPDESISGAYTQGTIDDIGIGTFVNVNGTNNGLVVDMDDVRGVLNSNPIGPSVSPVANVAVSTSLIVG